MGLVECLENWQRQAYQGLQISRDVDESKREQHEERRTWITKEEQEVEAEETTERTEPSIVV